MSRTKTRALMGACVMALASGLAAVAHAETYVYGGGSSLIAPYDGQGFACLQSDNAWNQTTGPGIYTKGSSASSPDATFTAIPTPVLSPTCPHASLGYSLNYDSTGSGAGQVGLFAHDAIIGTNLDSSGHVTTSTAILWGSASSGTAELFSTVNYAMSDNSLVNADAAVYNVGTGGTYTTSFNGNTATITAAAAYQGMTFASGNSPHNGGTNSTAYPIPATRYGALVQFPISVDPVAAAYNPKYVSVSSGGARTTYSLQVKSSLQNADGSGGLNLTDAALCAIYEGTITDWSDSTLTTLNGGQSLLDSSDTGATHPITIVGRTDGSGTTSIFTRHMAAVCGDAAVWGSAGTTTLPSAVTSLGNFVGGSGSGGVASAINANVGAIGYLGPDYALPYVSTTGFNTYGLNVADLSSSGTSGTFYEPSPSRALIAFGSLLPPQSTTTGAYNSSDTTTDRKDPTQWVQSTSSSSVLANPTASGAYPIVGTTNYIGYTCYAALATVTDLESFLNNALTSAQGSQILSGAGLAQLPSAWGTAIVNTFLEANGDASGLDLFMSKANVGKTNPNCTVTGSGA